MKLPTRAVSLGVLGLALALAGCTNTPDGMGMDPSDDSSTGSVTFNIADETFVMAMIPHHEQAIEMADLLLDKEGIDERITDLALDIKAAQGPEIELMNGWLDEWGITMDPGMEGMDHGGGMMSDDDMTALEDASGAEAGRLFLEQMIEHHEGAIDMAQQELDHGENPDARELAGAIIEAQTAEIATMEGILADL